MTEADILTILKERRSNYAAWMKEHSRGVRENEPEALEKYSSAAGGFFAMDHVIRIIEPAPAPTEVGMKIVKEFRENNPDNPFFKAFWDELKKQQP